MRIRIVGVVLGLVILVGATFVTYYQASNTNALSWWGESFPFIGFTATVLVMFTGIVFGCLFRRLGGRQGPVRLGEELKAVFTSTSFISSLCVSPFVFMSVYAAVSAKPGDAASYLLAFQNGFFCESIFNQLQAAKRS